MSVKSVYVAAPFSQREAAKAAREKLESLGIEVTSRWIDSHLEEIDLMTDRAKDKEATDDLVDVYRADGFVLLNNTGAQSTSGGMHIEFGYAIGARKPIFILGPKTTIFHYLPTVRQISMLEEIRWAK